MNLLLHDRLTEHLGPHRCTPHNGACDLPHFRFNFVLPCYIEQWPVESLAAAKADEVRDRREIARALREDGDS